MNSKDTAERLAKCVTAYYFLDKYNDLEGYIKDLFKKSVGDASTETKNKIYFLAGGGQISTHINAKKIQVETNPVKFKGEDSLWKFNLTQIMNMNDEFNILPVLTQEINMLQRNGITISLKECIKIFGSMRNKLVHQTENAIFKETDIVERLTIKNIVSYQTEHDFDDLTGSMDDVSQELVSNIIYLDIVLKKLKEEELKV